MNMLHNAKHQRGLSAWTLIGSLLIAAGFAGLGVAWFKPIGPTPSVNPGISTVANAGSAAMPLAPLAPNAKPAAPSEELAVSTAGLGGAKFGMDIDSVERAMGRPLVLPEGKSRAQVRGMDCSYARVSGLAEVVLRFEKGQFTAVDINQPNVATRSGFKVGDPERSVIDKVKGDPTYTRSNSHYDDDIKEITVGKFEMVGQGLRQKPSGYLLKFTAAKGRITHIQSGAADYVTLVEHDEDCEN